MENINTVIHQRVVDIFALGAWWEIRNWSESCLWKWECLPQSVWTNGRSWVPEWPQLTTPLMETFDGTCWVFGDSFYLFKQNVRGIHNIWWNKLVLLLVKNRVFYMWQFCVVCTLTLFVFSYKNPFPHASYSPTSLIVDHLRSPVTALAPAAAATPVPAARCEI